MDPGEPGGELLRTALEERRARAPRILDACRAALEPLLALAERGGVDLAIPVAATPWQVPSPREAQLLMEEFSGAPLGIALSPARWAVLEALQLPRAAERWTPLARSARLLWASDCVGLETELLPGLGELEWSKTGGWPPQVSTILTGASDVHHPRGAAGAPAPGGGLRRFGAYCSSSVSCLVMPLRMLPAIGVSRKPTSTSTCRREGSTATRASNPLRDTIRLSSPSQRQVAP